MSGTAELDRVLEEAAELLLQADTQTVLESLQRGEAPDAREVDLLCDWCSHAWHGLACCPPPVWMPGPGLHAPAARASAALVLPEPDNPLWKCRCSSSRERLDDTWRPRPVMPPFYDLDGMEVMAEWRLSERMAATGMDGYVLRALFHPAARNRADTAARLRREIRAAVVQRETAS